MPRPEPGTISIPTHRLTVAFFAALCAALVLPPSALADRTRPWRDPVRQAPSRVHFAGPQQVGGPETARSRAGQELLSRGYLVPDPAGYVQAKAALEARSTRNPTTGGGRAVPPSEVREFSGTFDPRTIPPDPTGAIGLKRYVQLVNTRYAIFKRDGSRVSSGDLGVLTGLGRNFPYLTDPQVIWDASTRRFYYVVLDFDIAVRNRSDGIDFAFGFSKTAKPNRARDWCKYTLSFGYDDPSIGSFRVPDQPHLGDTKGFLLWGANVFDLSIFEPRYLGSDVDWIAKPRVGRTCPSPASFRTGARHKLRTALGARAFTPVVANQVDPSATGWVVATSGLATERSRGRTISVFRVTRSRAGEAVIQGRARSVHVRSYGLPPPAPQAGTGRTLDTLDGRLLQAVAAVDPSRHGVAVWTQHSVAGGAGSAVRWYEIDPFHHRLFQSGQVANSTLFAFNGAVSPDRVAREGVRRFGRAMVLGFNTSSKETEAAVQMVSKIGAATRSPFVRIKQSRGPNGDPSCRDTGPCRWGDFSGASPDPAAPTTRIHGSVWLTNMWNVADRPGVDWRTVIWQARP
jgi:hypothetical protein